VSDGNEAVCRTYDDLRRAVAAICSEQGITRQQLDAEAGLADGHSAKLLSPRAMRAVKRFGFVSLGRILDALELEIVLRRRADAVSRDLPENHTHENTSEQKPAKQDWRRNRGSAWGKRMAAIRALSMTAEQRSASARKAIRARWNKRNEQIQVAAASVPVVERQQSDLS
jgi:hypothetical protein